MAKNFKMSDFIKCNGTKCHMIYIQVYYDKMVKVIHYEKKFIRVFYDNLNEF